MTVDAGAFVLDGTSGDAAMLGGKGAALDRLIGWGLTVPTTGVVPASVYRLLVGMPAVEDLLGRVRAGDPVPAEEVDAVFAAQDLPPTLTDRVVSVAAEVAEGRTLAVRSSATVEDLDQLSFAGQYRSLLDIDPEDPEILLRSVKLVWASLWHPAPHSYRSTLGVDDRDIAMAVVLMRMVPARHAGVVFTVDPGGTAGAARIEAVEGLAESLVSGDRTPEAFVADRETPDPGLPPYVRRALEQSLVAESHTGRPQDVEWAWDGERLWVVQARPITVQADGDGFDSPTTDDDLTSVGIGEMLPGILPPLRWELAGHVVDEAFRRVFADLGVLPAEWAPGRGLLRRVRGRAVLDFGRLHAMADRLPGASAAELEAEYFGSRRAGRAAVPPTGRAGWLHRLRHDVRTARTQRRAVLDADIAIEATALVCDEPLPLAELDPRALLAHRTGLLDLAVRAAGAELGVAASAAAAYRRVELLLLPALGEVEAGRWAERMTSSRSVLVRPHRDASAAVFAGPTWEELGTEPPELEGFDHTEAVAEALEDALAASGSWATHGVRAMIRTRALRHAIADAIAQLHRREASKAALLRLGGEVRRIHLALGAHLVAAGVLTVPDDVELMTTGEIRRSFRGRTPPPVILQRRGTWRDRYKAMAPLPARFRGVPPAPPPVDTPGDRLEGWAASPGSYRGSARLMRDPGDPFEDGAVLVAEATDASWSPLFLRAGAIVLERGGPLSHAAILARELGVPAVLNVPGAARALDGQTVEVDGDAGVIVVVDEHGGAS